MMSLSKFLDACEPCEGTDNLAAFLLSGIQKVIPDLYESLQESRVYTFDDLAVMLKEFVEI